MLLRNANISPRQIFITHIRTEKRKKEKGVEDNQSLTPEFVLACGSHTVSRWLINLGFERMFYYKSLSVTVTTQEGQIMCLSETFHLLKLNTRA